MSTTHEHRAIRTYDRCYTGPVSRNENPLAHGCICEIEVCDCGAERRANVNGCYVEQGSWVEEIDEHDDCPSVRDPEGGVWYPTFSAAREILASDDPVATAARICRDQPHRGTWHARRPGTTRPA